MAQLDTHSHSGTLKVTFLWVQTLRLPESADAVKMSLQHAQQRRVTVRINVAPGPINQGLGSQKLMKATDRLKLPGIHISKL